MKSTPNLVPNPMPNPIVMLVFPCIRDCSHGCQKLSESVGKHFAKSNNFVLFIWRNDPYYRVKFLAGPKLSRSPRSCLSASGILVLENTIHLI